MRVEEKVHVFACFPAAQDILLSVPGLEKACATVWTWLNVKESPTHPRLLAQFHW